MAQDPLIPHLAAKAERAEQLAAALTRDMQQYRDCVSAIKALVRRPGPVSPVLLRSTLAAYGLGDA